MMAEDASSRSTLDPVGMALLHKSVEQHFIGSIHNLLFMQDLVTKSDGKKISFNINGSHQASSTHPIIYMKCLFFPGRTAHPSM